MEAVVTCKEKVRNDRLTLPIYAVFFTFLFSNNNILKFRSHVLGAATTTTTLTRYISDLREESNKKNAIHVEMVYYCVSCSYFFSGSSQRLFTAV